MPSPNWSAAVAGTRGDSGQISQVMLGHNVQLVYAGTRFSSQTTAGSGTVTGNSLYVAQSFTTGASTTAVGRITLTGFVTGNPSLLNLSTPLVTTLSPVSWMNTSNNTYTWPLPVTGLSVSTQYWIVASWTGSTGNTYTFTQSNQTSGTSTSTNGTAWTAQAYGIEYQVYDQTQTLPLTHTWEDNGMRITWLPVNTAGYIGSIEEFTQTVSETSGLYSYRNINYSGSFPVSTT
jgi:hypothetical protein